MYLAASEGWLVVCMGRVFVQLLLCCFIVFIELLKIVKNIKIAFTILRFA